MLNILKEAKIPMKRLSLVLFLVFMYAGFEGAGLSMMLPILMYVEQGGHSNQAELTGYLGDFQNFLAGYDMALSLPLLIVCAAIPMLLRQVILFLKAVAVARIENDYLYTMRSNAIERYLSSGLSFFLNHTHGEITTSINVICSQASVIVRASIDIVGFTLLLLLYTSLLFIISPNLTLMAIPIFAFSGLIVGRQLLRGKELGRSIGATSEELGSVVSESINSVRLIKGRGIEEKTIDGLKKATRELSDLQVQFAKTQSAIEAKVNPILIMGVFLILYIAVDYWGMSVAELGIFLFIIARASPLILQVNNSRLTIQSGLQLAKKINDLKAEALNHLDVKGGDVQFAELKKGVEYKNIHFKYGSENGNKVLNDVSFTINRGETIALVGPSGAGKSTLIDLIPRYYEPNEGQICIDGIDIKDFDHVSLRRKIAYVSQDPSFFHDTVRYNIEVGLDEKLSDEELQVCLQKSHAQDFVERLSDGVDTVVGEQGRMLSGGQRQRLAIARALAQKAEILILDEPTSALDAASEEKVKASIKDLHGELTIFIIAHRLSTIRHADKIVYLDGGKLIGCGKHDELIETLPAYREMVELQNIG